jgi:hypothetical protein
LLCGSRRFGELQRGVPGISPSLLAKRLRQLEAAGVIARLVGERGPEYEVTTAGAELYPIIEAMGVWGQRWARSRYTPGELDPGFLMWDMRRMLRADGLAPLRTVVEFRFHGAPPGPSVFWMIIDGDIDVCVVDPGHPVDLWVRADLRALTEVWMGDRTMADALDTGAIAIDGSRPLARRFPGWLGQHPVLARYQAAG